MSHSTAVAIIGAGPYGLSIATHLRERGIEHRIFGDLMHSWRARMPKGMFLKSEGCASDLYDPTGRYTLQDFCARNGLTYADYNSPVPLDTFCAYGNAFQRDLVPELENKSVAALESVADGFRLRLDDGEEFSARHVVVAAGVTHFGYVPPDLAHLPPDFLSHSADHHDLSRFRGRDVTVIGGGASAIDLVAGLREVGADVRLVTRRSSLRWNTPIHRPAWKQWYPVSGLGGGWQNRFYENAPMLFRRLPQQKRQHIVRTWLGPSGAWPVRDIVEQAPLLLAHDIRLAKMNASRVYLRVAGPDGIEHNLPTEHIIAATGYRVDLGKLPFLNGEFASRVRTTAGSPVLSGDFESSIPGLYFTGLAAALTFGPVMRFLLGARYTARRLSRRLAGLSAQ
jgi:cation diffusion facilitator CzcD-associated flavoprotein CzcO